MRQYAMNEWSCTGLAPEGSWVDVDLTAVFSFDGVSTEVKGFYAGDGTYKVRFYPEQTGLYQCTMKGSAIQEEIRFEEVCEPAEKGSHGIVRADGTHFRHADGTWFYPFGTTVYALSHQEDAWVETTFDTLSKQPFNKVRMCLFPKHYNYNHNEPPYYAFEKNGDGWDVHHPCMAFWDRFESQIMRLGELGIQVDLIIFHPYDRWGFSKLGQEDAKVYLDYLTRRFSTFPNLWWSLANEYDLMDYEKEDWIDFAHFIHTHDPYHHLLSNHQMIIEWDFANEDTTHICLQTSKLEHLSAKITKYGKPLVVDECKYEGNVTDDWGNISARELIHRFWTIIVQGGYATHGETYMNAEERLWWASGGRLVGESPARIRFLREIIEELPGPLTFAGVDQTQEDFEQAKSMMTPEILKTASPVVKIMAKATWEEAMDLVNGHREMIASCEGETAFLKYIGRKCPYQGTISLPEEGVFRVEVIDTWEMTRTVVSVDARGEFTYPLPSKEGMAVLAVRIG